MITLKEIKNLEAQRNTLLKERYESYCDKLGLEGLIKDSIGKGVKFVALDLHIGGGGSLVGTSSPYAYNITELRAYLLSLGLRLNLGHDTPSNKTTIVKISWE